MKALRARLAEAGVNRTFLNRVVLPSWWNDAIAASEGGLREIAGYISAHLGFSVASLLDPKAPLELVARPGVKFKKPKRATTDDVSLATHVALGLARTVAHAFADRPVAPVPAPEEWRQTILARNDKAWVTLPAILQAAWQAGIAVVPLRVLPDGAKKPDALTTMVGDRPVIVILNGRKSPSWIAFIVAHELGHIERGHLKPGATLVDAKIDTQAEDAEESEANVYASRLLTGHANLGLHATRSLNIPQLAQAAEVFGHDYRVAPGVAALNYGFTTGAWAVANGAVTQLEKDQDACAMLRDALTANLTADAFTDEAWEWVRRATGTPE